MTEFSCKRDCYLNSEDPLSQSQCQFPNKETACFHCSNTEWSLTQCWPFTFWKCSGHHWRLNVCLWRPESSQEGKGSREPRRRWSLSWRTKTWNTWRRTLAMMKRRYESGSGGTWHFFYQNWSEESKTFPPEMFWNLKFSFPPLTLIHICSGFKAVCPTGVLDRNSILEMYDMPMKTAIRF